MIDADAATARAELVALQAVLIAVFRRLAHDRPELAPTFCSAFDEAETVLTGVTMRIGLDAPRECTVGALKIIEELRAAVIRDRAACRDD